MIAVAPGKLILSGEHAVVYQQPALVMAVNRFARATLETQAQKNVTLYLADLSLTSTSTTNALRVLKRRLEKNYTLFLREEISIRQVVTKPTDVFNYMVIRILDAFQLDLQLGIRIIVQSDIPIGCGMGSSAATVLSVLRVLAAHFNLAFVPEKFYAFTIEVERLVHGTPSGVDPFVSLHGGCYKFQNGQTQVRPIPSIPMYVVNTGIPQATTGECVSFVASHFATSSIWNEFGTVTDEIDQSIRGNDFVNVQKQVRQNHRLLMEIGVVPEQVGRFISEIETLGGAAKISGAGSIRGDHAGIVLIFAEKPPIKLCQKYRYEVYPVQGESFGARVV